MNGFFRLIGSGKRARKSAQRLMGGIGFYSSMLRLLPSPAEDQSPLALSRMAFAVWSFIFFTHVPYSLTQFFLST